MAWPNHHSKSVYTLDHSNTAACSSPGSCWDAVSEEQDIGKEVELGFLQRVATECRFKVCHVCEVEGWWNQ